MRLMDRVLAVHDSRLARGTVVNAPPQTVYQAALDTDLVGVWRRNQLVRLLIAARSVPDKVARRVRGEPARAPAPASGTLAELPDRGLWVRLAEEPGHEYVFGAVGRFWGPRVELRETEAEEFAGFWERGWGKIRGGASPSTPLTAGGLFWSWRRARLPPTRCPASASGATGCSPGRGYG